ncbi:RsmD family RNA methyltransferase [Verminephrobacter eiseniae]|uniref:RsmD family RNA methyltransferase n=1 Tax=Verminephrobacter eiseniae TaxID=364317 RepID=UPI000674E49C
MPGGRPGQAPAATGSRPKVPAADRKSTAPAKGRKPGAAPAKGRPPGATSDAPGVIRIIGGRWKRTRLPVARHPGLRPTPERVRAALFNWLGQDLAGWRCLDAFAGTGALGLEAASRGAAAVQLIDSDAALVARLHGLQQRLQAGAADERHLPACALQIRRGDGIAALRQAAPASIDLVLLDPPFDSALFEPALQCAARAVAATGFVYLEAPRAWSDAQLAPLGLVLQRHLKAGAVHAHLLRPGPAGPA